MTEPADRHILPDAIEKLSPQEAAKARLKRQLKEMAERARRQDPTMRSIEVLKRGQRRNG